MNTNQGLQQMKQSGGYKLTPVQSTKRRHSQGDSKSRSGSRSGSNHPLQNPAHLQKIMSLFE